MAWINRDGGWRFEEVSARSRAPIARVTKSCSARVPSGVSLLLLGAALIGISMLFSAARKRQC